MTGVVKVGIVLDDDVEPLVAPDHGKSTILLTSRSFPDAYLFGQRDGWHKIRESEDVCRVSELAIKQD